MRYHLLPFVAVIVISACETKIDPSHAKQEIFKAEKDFEKMVGDKGLAEAFYFFADDSAVIKRDGDKIIKGKDAIKQYYQGRSAGNPDLKWTPDYIGVSPDGMMAFTYGKFVWQSQGDSGKIDTFSGVFHTVWKRQRDKSWKFVWD